MTTNLCIPIQLVNFSNITRTAEVPELTFVEQLEEFMYSRVVVCIAVAGVFGNLLNLGVLTKHSMQSHRERMERAVSVGLVLLSVADLIFCLFLIPHAWIPRKQFYFDSRGFSFIYEQYRNFVINTTVMVSTWLTVAMATSRYIAICHPLRARYVIDMKYTLLTTLAIVLVSISMNSARLWTVETGSMQCRGNWTAHYLYTGPLAKCDICYSIYLWIYFFFSTILPLILLTTCNVYLVRALKQSDRLRRIRAPTATSCSSESSRRLTAILIGLVIMYTLLVSPAQIITFLRETLMGDNAVILTPAYNLAVSFVNFLQALNFSLNFVLYCSVNTQFRNSFRQLLCMSSVSEPHLLKALDTVLVIGTEKSATTTTMLTTYSMSRRKSSIDTML